MALEARLEADEREVGLADHVEERVHLRGVDGGRSSTLVTRGLGEVADERDLGLGCEGQDVPLVLEKDDALRGSLAGERMVGFGVEARRGVGYGLVRLHGKLDGVEHAGVDVRLGEGARLDGGEKLAGGAVARRGHLERGLRPDAGGMVVRAAPVGDDGAFEAPLVAKNVLEQVLVLVGVGAVDEVVRAHDRLGVGLAHHDLEAREVDLAQGALVDDRVGRLAAGLLAVDGKVLGAGGEAGRLHAAHVGGGHLAGQVGILGEVLEVAAAERAALDAEARAENDAHALDGGLLGHGVADLLAELGIPRVGHRDRGGEAGGRLGPVETEVVSGASLVPETVGAVGEGDRRNPQPGVRPAPKGRSALEQHALLLERQLAEHLFVVHRVSSAWAVRALPSFLSRHGTFSSVSLGRCDTFGSGGDIIGFPRGRRAGSATVSGRVHERSR